MNRDVPADPSFTEPMPRRDSAQRERSMTEPMQGVAVDPGRAVTEPAPPIAPPIEAPTEATKYDSEPLRQLEGLSALVEQELRKSRPRLPGDAPPSPEPAPTADEESLQSYLDRFMERVTGKKPDPVEPLAALKPSPVARQASTPIPARSGEPKAPAPQSPQQREPARPPERRETLAAMRDLANENARSAMATHEGRHHWVTMRMTFLTTVAASAISSICAIGSLVAAAPGTTEGAVCAGLIALLMACRFFLQCGRLTATSRMV
jgi:hypothetical protein